MTMEPIEVARAAFPADWGVARIRDVATVNGRSLRETTDPDFSFRYIDISSVSSDGEVSAPALLSFGEAPSRARRLISDGDILVSTVRTYLRAIARIESGRDMVASTGFAVISPKPIIDAGFAYWWLRSHPLVEQIVSQSVGVSYPAINASEVAHLCVPMPPRDMQLRIASFLDARCGEIQQLLSEIDTLTALVSSRCEQARARMATRGLASTDLAPSGIQWLGDVPAHWAIRKLKYVAHLESGHTPSRSKPELWENCTIPWISLNDVGAMAGHEYIEDTVNLVSKAGIAASSARILPAGTVVLSRDATIGRTCIMATAMATSQHFANWTCGPQISPRYLWLLFSTAMQPYFDSLTDGATLRTIGMADLRSFVVTVPPLAEQAEIVSHAELVQVHADDTLRALADQKRLVVEHRQALVAAAVTGQLAVA